MGFRQVYITKAEKLSFSDSSLVIKKDKDSVISIPIEDLDVVFIEDPTTVLTTRLLNELSLKGVALISCGADYLPSSICIPFNGYYKQSGMLSLQMNLLPSKKNKLWETIIKAKISNQMEVLKNAVNDIDSYKTMAEYVKNVKFGDENNMEGIAAKCYFRSLFGPSFIRFSESPISAALNYGYSIFAGLLIRDCAFNGLNGNLGVWHDNVQNANNLAYDLLEPFRPVVDYYVYNNLARLTTPLSKEVRCDLINLVNYYVMVKGKKYQVSYAMNLLVNDFMRYLTSGNIAEFNMPSFFPNEESHND